MAIWDLKEHHYIIIIIKNHNGKISIEFPESVNFERSYFKKVGKNSNKSTCHYNKIQQIFIVSSFVLVIILFDQGYIL